MEEDIKHLCGDIRIIFALKKNASIANQVVRNRKLGENPLEITKSNTPPNTQSCGASGCMLCPLLIDLNEKIEINGLNLILDNKLTCKNKNCIYVAICQICKSSNSYFGQTVTAVRTRFNGHRGKFDPNDIKVCEKSQHCLNIALIHILIRCLFLTLKWVLLRLVIL